MNHRTFKLKLLSLLVFLTSIPQLLVCNLPSIEEFPDNERICTYLHFLNTFHESLGPSGDYSKGEIQIVLDPEKIQEIESLQKKRLMKRGLSVDDATRMSQCGIIDTDTYWIWIRDAVVFPTGYEGTYNRVVWRSAVDGPGNVAILPVLKDGRVILNLNYRHSTRSWEIELPRGGRFYGETPEKACRRGLRSETGCLTDSQVYLGSITADTSTVTTVTPVFLGYVSEQIESDQDPSEAILGLITLSKQEIKEAFIRGFIEIKMNGEIKKVPFRDSFLAYALLQAESKALI
ncbi:MAG: hypothetical protein S4CHLAM7_13790 [Chlamydiae bacterium]|nr:hypothetical protein [Chlamydiota bacterium]